jgi:hypoxanthine phosphoribosyltransferase
MHALKIEIFEGSDEPGYFYDIYLDDSEDSEDGGFCTTTIENALEMAMEQAQNIIKLNIMKENQTPYYIADYETNNAIFSENFATITEAEKFIEEAEEEDRKNGEYTPNYYQILKCPF